jgi:hypothetical protein
MKYAQDRLGLFLIPLFYSWRASDCVVWPDGAARIHQPYQLVSAFAIMNAAANQAESVEMEIKQKRIKHG